jgi:hypothetical protein
MLSIVLKNQVGLKPEAITMPISPQRPKRWETHSVYSAMRLSGTESALMKRTWKARKSSFCVPSKPV